MKPNKNEYPPYYQSYIDKCSDNDIVTNLSNNHKESIYLLKNIPEEKANFAYAEDKWSIKELVQHMIDSERVFAYRGMCIARGDTTPLPGFDENAYAANSFANNRTLESLINEFDLVRLSTIDLFNSFNNKVLLRVGNANGLPISVRAIGYITAGHTMHHINILRERYL